MKVKGRRRSKNVEDRRGLPKMASVLNTIIGMEDYTMMGNADPMLGGPLLPYVLDSDTRAPYDPMHRRPVPMQPPRPRPNPKRRKKTLAHGE